MPTRETEVIARQFSLNILCILPQRGSVSKPRVGVLFANPGENSNALFNPVRIASGHNPYGIEMQMNLIPELNAKSRVQPWALGSNAFGVESGTEAIMGGLLSQRPCRNLNKLPTVSRVSRCQRRAVVSRTPQVAGSA